MGITTLKHKLKGTAKCATRDVYAYRGLRIAVSRG